MFCIFFVETTGPVIVCYFEEGFTITTIIDKKKFKTNCLFPILIDLNKQRPTSIKKNIKIHYDNARSQIR